MIISTMFILIPESEREPCVRKLPQAHFDDSFMPTGNALKKRLPRFISVPFQVGWHLKSTQGFQKALLRLWFHNHFGVTVTFDDKSYIQILSPEENTHISKSL